MRDPRDQFGPTAKNYLSSAVHSNPSALGRLVEITRPSGGIVADIATGAGHTAYAFAPFVDRVVATDITPSMLEVTRSEAKKRGLQNLDVAFALAEDLPFKDASLSGITCRLGAHHFKDVREFIGEVRRSLEPGAWFTLADTIGSEDSQADDLVDRLERVRDASHMRNYRRSEWLAMLAEAGFEVRHHEIVWKEIDTLDWMERMNVPDAGKASLMKMIETSSGEFAAYLKPERRDGRLFFHLAEIALNALRTGN